MNDKRNPYQDLAAFLDPADPPQGAREIDKEILRYERARCRPWNWARAWTLTGRLMAVASTPIVGTHILEWLHIPNTLSQVAYARWWLNLAQTVPLAVGVGLLLGGFLSAFNPFDGLEFTAPALPPRIAAWLAENRPEKPDIAYWAEAYWPPFKEGKYHHELFGFTFWKKAP